MKLSIVWHNQYGARRCRLLFICAGVHRNLTIQFPPCFPSSLPPSGVTTSPKLICTDIIISFAVLIMDSESGYIFSFAKLVINFTWLLIKTINVGLIYHFYYLYYVMSRFICGPFIRFMLVIFFIYESCG